MMTFEAMMEKVHHNIAMLHKRGDEEMPRERKLTLIKESLALLLERGDLEQQNLDGINAGTITFPSQSEALGEYNRCVSVIEVCRDKSSDLIRERDQLLGTKTDLFTASPVPTPQEVAKKLVVPCKVCGKPIYLDLIPPHIAGPMGDVLRETLMKLTTYLVHEGCTRQARLRAKQPLRQLAANP